MANIKFSGNIGKDPDLRYTPEGKAQVTFSVALYTGKNKDGEYNASPLDTGKLRNKIS